MDSQFLPVTFRSPSTTIATLKAARQLIRPTSRSLYFLKGRRPLFKAAPKRTLEPGGGSC